MSVVPGTAGLILSAEQIADFAKQAGFSGENLAIAVAVALAESSGSPSARGDLDIQDSTYGPSIGLWQIHSLKAQKGTKGQRDELALYDPAFNARSAYAISSGGSNWRPWSAFTDGSYKRHLGSAGTAANSTTSRGGSAGSLTAFEGDINYAVPPPSALSVEPVASRKPDNLSFIGPLSTTVIGGRWTSGEIDMTTDQVCQISITFCDPDYELWRGPWKNRGEPAIWDGWKLELSGWTGGLRDGVWYTTLRFWPKGVFDLRRIQGQIRFNVSPGEWIAAEAQQYGIQVQNYEAHGLRSDRIGPDQSEAFGPTSTEQKEPETAWGTMQRLAQENGCWLYVTPDALVFGKPTILARALSYVDCGFRGSVNNDQSLDWTNFEPDESSSVSTLVNDKTATVYLPRWRGERVRPGMALRFPGFAGWDNQNYIAKRVSWPLDGGLNDVAISVEKPVNPKVQTSSAGLGEAIDLGQLGQTTGGSLSKGTKMAKDFVAFAVSQQGKKYIYGAAPDASNPDPAGYDCSGLVRWAAAQVGISMPRTSDAQLAACYPISLEQAAGTLGALIFRKGAGAGGHVVISLGDGRRTIEARGEAYGVVSYLIKGRDFNAAGLIKGMNYGTGSSQSSVFDGLPNHSTSGSGGGGGVGAG